VLPLLEAMEAAAIGRRQRDLRLTCGGPSRPRTLSLAERCRGCGTRWSIIRRCLPPSSAKYYNLHEVVGQSVRRRPLAALALGAAPR